MMNTFNTMVCDLDAMLSKSADTQARIQPFSVRTRQP